MKKYLATILETLLLGLILSACGAPGGGPQAWIDMPLDNSTAPLGPISMMAHASDSDGVASFEFYVNGQYLSPSVIPPDGEAGTRLAHAEKEYTPAGPGEYRIEVRAIDSAGNTGSPAFAKVTISGEAASLPPGQDLPTEPPPAEPPPDVPEEEPEVVPAVTTPIVVAQMNANCRQGPGTNYGIYGSLLEGQNAEIKGRLSDNSWLLIALTDRSSNCWIAASVVNIQGDLETISVAAAPPPPANEPPPADVIPPGPIDTTPPLIMGTGTSSNSICAYESVTSNIVTGDEESGIKKVYASWVLTDNNGITRGSGSMQYNPIPSQPFGFTAVFGGPFDYPGTLSINGTVENNANPSLTTTFFQQVSVTLC